MKVCIKLSSMLVLKVIRNLKFGLMKVLSSIVLTIGTFVLFKYVKFSNGRSRIIRAYNKYVNKRMRSILLVLGNCLCYHATQLRVQLISSFTP